MGVDHQRWLGPPSLTLRFCREATHLHDVRRVAKHDGGRERRASRVGNRIYSEIDRRRRHEAVRREPSSRTHELPEPHVQAGRLQTAFREAVAGLGLQVHDELWRGFADALLHVDRRDKAPCGVVVPRYGPRLGRLSLVTPKRASRRQNGSRISILVPPSGIILQGEGRYRGHGAARGVLGGGRAVSADAGSRARRQQRRCGHEYDAAS
jgi:hypothetical protein